MYYFQYLNCGAGSLAGLYIHERHFDHKYPRLTGWWGHQLQTRFKMDNGEQSTIQFIFSLHLLILFC